MISWIGAALLVVCSSNSPSAGPRRFCFQRGCCGYAIDLDGSRLNPFSLLPSR
jgi:hypothetical protein